MKTETKHTQGPWTYYLTISDNGPVPQVQTVPVGPVGGAYATMICTLSQTGKKSGTQLANARLIAAAPELLAELHSVRVQLEAQALGYSASEIWPHVRTEIVRRISDAISKAEGNA